MDKETTLFQDKLREMWWKGLLLFQSFVPYECKWGKSELISQLSYQQDKGNTCFIRKPTKRKTFGIFRYISGLCLSFQFLSRAAPYYLPNSQFSLKQQQKKVLWLEWICVEVLQSETRVSMTLVFCGDRVRRYLDDHKAKASQRVGNGSQYQFHYISDSHLWRQDLSAVTGWHTLKPHVYFLTLCTLIPWKRCMW